MFHGTDPKFYKLVALATNYIETVFLILNTAYFIY